MRIKWAGLHPTSCRYFDMSMVKEEPLSDEQWNQLFKEPPNYSDVTFPDLQGIPAEQSEAAAGDAASLNLDSFVCPLIESVDHPAATANGEWTHEVPVSQGETPTNESHRVNPEISHLMLEVGEIKNSCVPTAS